jgi:hypothetical protein
MHVKLQRQFRNKEISQKYEISRNSVSTLLFDASIGKAEIKDVRTFFLLNTENFPFSDFRQLKD